jgi:RHS repeat-associated protein
VRSNRNILGSTWALSDAAGALTNSYQTDEYGVPGAGAGTSTQPFGYTGEMRDAETGLLNLRARMYDPETGRMMQRDRFAGRTSRPGTLNRYAYVLNNPVNFVDPSGLQSEADGSIPDLTGSIHAGRSASIGAAGLYGSSSAGIGASSSGEVGTVTTVGYGGTSAAAVASQGYYAAYESSPTLTGLEGVGHSAGVSFDTPIGGVGIDVGVEAGAVTGAAVSYSPPNSGVSVPSAEVHATQNHTNVSLVDVGGVVDMGNGSGTSSEGVPEE